MRICNGRLQDSYHLYLLRFFKDLLPEGLHCTLENIRLVFHPSTNESTPPEGVQIKIPGWGTSKAVEYVDDSLIARLLHVGYDAAPLVDGKHIPLTKGYELTPVV